LLLTSSPKSSPHAFHTLPLRQMPCCLRECSCGILPSSSEWNGPAHFWNFSCLQQSMFLHACRTGSIALVRVSMAKMEMEFMVYSTFLVMAVLQPASLRKAQTRVARLASRSRDDMAATNTRGRVLGRFRCRPPLLLPARRDRDTREPPGLQSQ
jgi:hypothetical protein